MPANYTAIHVLNQFFGGRGGEEAADLRPEWADGPQGPGHLFQNLAKDITITGTVITGDNFAAGHSEETRTLLIAMIRERIERGDIPKPDLVIAGPAFLAGRYGMACGAACAELASAFDVPVVTGMHPENPGVEAYRQHVCIAETADNVMGMPDAVERMVHLAHKLLRDEAIDPQRDHAFARGVRLNEFASRTGAQRALDMLLRKVTGQPYESEYTIPAFDRVAPAPPVPDSKNATIALVTSGGIVPRGNPDHIPSASADRYGSYDIKDLGRLDGSGYQTAHGGYDPTFADADPNRVVPLDAARALEADGRIGRLHQEFYSTVGNATSIRQSQEFGREIAATLISSGVHAVILTST